MHSQLELSSFLKVTESVFHFISVAACADSRLHAEIYRLINIVLTQEAPHGLILLSVLLSIFYTLINTAAAMFSSRTKL